MIRTGNQAGNRAGSRLAVVLAGFMLACALMGGCQTMTKPTPAVLVEADAAAMTNVKAALAKAMGQAQVELGPLDLTRSPDIPVLPRRPAQVEDRSLAVPTIFRLEMVEGNCFVAGPGEARERVEGVRCRPL